MVLATRQHIKVKEKKTSFIGRSYKNYNKEEFVNDLLNSNWLPVETSTDPEFIWKFLLDKIKTLLDHTCPLKRFRVKVTNKPWITNELIEQIKGKDRALKKAKRSGSNEDWARARRLRNDCLKAVRNAKARFIQDELDNHSMTLRNSGIMYHQFSP